MARRRSSMGGFLMQLTLQTAILVTAVQAADAAEFTFSKPALLSAPADDAFVYTAPIEPMAQQSVGFEDFAMGFYLPPEPTPAYDSYAPMPADDYALLGGPAYDYHSDDFFFGN